MDGCGLEISLQTQALIARKGTKPTPLTCCPSTLSISFIGLIPTNDNCDPRWFSPHKPSMYVFPKTLRSRLFGIAGSIILTHLNLANSSEGPTVFRPRGRRRLRHLPSEKAHLAVQGASGAGGMETQGGFDSKGESRMGQGTPTKAGAWRLYALGSLQFFCCA